MSLRGDFHWYSRAPVLTNRRINPGIRHQSRLHLLPKAWVRMSDEYGDVQMKRIQNSFAADPQVLMMLVDAMHIFSYQLPNMGTAYIARLVFDVDAFTVCLMNNGRTSGGICSKIFPKESFIEIVFCAVESRFQQRGFGRIMMNYVKFYNQAMKIYDILACADNEAVNYFRKQGFNKDEILIDPARWVGRIKDYDGITLVYADVRMEVDYLNFPKSLNKQRKLVAEKTGIGVMPPLESLKPVYLPFPESPCFVNVPIPEILKSYAPIGGSWQKKHLKQFTEDYDARMSVLREQCMAMLDALKANQKFVQVFGTPVTDDLAPGYFGQIKHPMDFSTIEKRLMRYPDYYKSPEVFAMDIKLMCDNCKQFNSQDTSYYRTAVELMKKFTEIFDSTFPGHCIP